MSALIADTSGRKLVGLLPYSAAVVDAGGWWMRFEVEVMSSIQPKSL